MSEKRDIAAVEWMLCLTPEGYGVCTSDAQHLICVSTREREMKTVADTHNELLDRTETAEKRAVALETEKVRLSLLLERAAKRLADSERQYCPADFSHPWPYAVCLNCRTTKRRPSRDERKACWSDWLTRHEEAKRE